MISDPHRVRGFTLLEMIVVLLVAGMALALATQALGQYQRAHQRISAVTQAGREIRLSEAWFRESVRGLAAIEPPALPAATGARSDERPDPVFKGTERDFHGVTLAPVLAGQGAPTHQHWQVEQAPDGWLLSLEEDHHRIQMRLPRATQARLHYLDADGDAHAQWPPAQGLWPQLPAIVLLEYRQDDGAIVVLAAAIAGPHEPLVLPYEPEPF